MHLAVNFQRWLVLFFVLQWELPRHGSRGAAAQFMASYFNVSRCTRHARTRHEKGVSCVCVCIHCQQKKAHPIHAIHHTRPGLGPPGSAGMWLTPSRHSHTCPPSISNQPMSSVPPRPFRRPTNLSVSKQSSLNSPFSLRAERRTAAGRGDRPAGLPFPSLLFLLPCPHALVKN